VPAQAPRGLRPGARAGVRGVRSRRDGRNRAGDFACAKTIERDSLEACVSIDGGATIWKNFPGRGRPADVGSARALFGLDPTTAG